MSCTTITAMEQNAEWLRTKMESQSSGRVTGGDLGTRGTDTFVRKPSVYEHCGNRGPRRVPREEFTRTIKRDFFSRSPFYFTVRIYYYTIMVIVIVIMIFHREYHTIFTSRLRSPTAVLWYSTTYNNSISWLFRRSGPLCSINETNTRTGSRFGGDDGRTVCSANRTRGRRPDGYPVNIYSLHNVKSRLVFDDNRCVEISREIRFWNDLGGADYRLAVRVEFTGKTYARISVNPVCFDRLLTIWKKKTSTLTYYVLS